MCLIAFSHHVHARYRLVLAANRDERHERPTAPMDFWQDDPQILAGRDLQGGGTWFGVTTTGRWAAVTNFYDGSAVAKDAPSRGLLVSDFLRSNEAPGAFLQQLRREARDYNGFNLLAGNLEEVGYFSNRENQVRLLAPGTYGLSNHLLDTPWPKVVRARGWLARELARPDVRLKPLLHMMTNTQTSGGEYTPETRQPGAQEATLAPIFIRNADYGTRSTTVLTVDREGALELAERRYDAEGKEIDTLRYSLDTSS